MENINIGFIYLLLAIISGCFTNYYLKISNGFKLVKPTLLAVFYSIILSFFLAKMYQTMKFGVGRSLYAISLIIFASIWGYIFYNEKLNFFGIVGIILIITGIICLYIK
tara:strand:- start:103 stop:429 length:327 start_codon:yes stop_codon:yes gene_type:complete